MWILAEMKEVEEGRRRFVQQELERFPEGYATSLVPVHFSRSQDAFRFLDLRISFL